MSFAKLAAYTVATIIVFALIGIVSMESLRVPSQPMTLSEAQSICGGAAYEDENEKFRCNGGKLATRR